MFTFEKPGAIRGRKPQEQKKTKNKLLEEFSKQGSIYGGRGRVNVSG